MKEYTLGDIRFGGPVYAPMPRPEGGHCTPVPPNRDDEILRELRLIRIALQTIAKQEVSE